MDLRDVMGGAPYLCELLQKITAKLLKIKGVIQLG